jgi:heat-inducible transcriptional repressor
MDSSALTERQKLILARVIQYYVETAEPVGSKRLVKRFSLPFSSATVRNEMGILAERGFLRQPHTSAGRIPTEDGYRYFVGQLMNRPTLPTSTKHTITHQFYQARHDVDQWMRLAASILAHQSQAASLITSPQSTQARIKHLELILTTGRQVLMILVLMSGKVIQQMLVLKEPVSQEMLSDIARLITGEWRGKNLRDLEYIHADLDVLGRDILKLLADELGRTERVITGEIFHDGWTNVLSEPEFAETGTARRALRVLEERPLLEDLLSQTVLKTDVGGVQVLIGGEGTWEELSDCSLVLSRYGVPELATGVLGIMGPIRMPYGNAISTVHFMAGLLSDLVTETMGDER